MLLIISIHTYVCGTQTDFLYFFFSFWNKTKKNVSEIKWRQIRKTFQKQTAMMMILKTIWSHTIDWLPFCSGKIFQQKKINISLGTFHLHTNRHEKLIFNSNEQKKRDRYNGMCYNDLIIIIIIITVNKCFLWSMIFFVCKIMTFTTHTHKHTEKPKTTTKYMSRYHDDDDDDCHHVYFSFTSELVINWSKKKWK